MSSSSKKRRRVDSSSDATKKSPKKSTKSSSNVYLDIFKKFQETMPKNMKRLFDPTLSESKRAKLFDRLDLAMAEDYAWAVPDERALGILKHYGPIVEIGAGRGYWGKMLIDRGVDYIGFDTEVPAAGDDTKNWCDIKKGTSKKLKKNSDRTLFLCYPDDFEKSDESLALACLTEYKGETIVLVGEAFGQTQQENPWGKTASSDFQEELNAQFHKVLQVPLPSWPGACDALSVWKRNAFCEVDDMKFRFIPEDERLDLVQTSPGTRHLV